MELTKQAGRVRLTRSLEQDENGKDAVIWTKTYQGTRTGQSGEIDLSVFNAWERTLILKAHDDGLNSCYRMAHLIEKGSGLHTDDTPDNVRQTRTTVIKTHHTGADLDIWRVMRPWSQGRLLEHPFVKQQHFLKLIRGVLFALHGFHSKRFVHCDLHPGNIVLPAEIKQLPTNSGEGDRYQLIARWDEIKLIDLGYSIHRGIEPPAMLPLALWELTTAGEYRRDAVGEKIPSKRMSPHLHNRLCALDTIASKWPASEVFSRKRWEQHQENLRNLQELDWREDLYQLGYWLTKMRDGDEDGSWGDVRYVGDVVNVREVNAFICDFPQELMDWGLKRPLPDVMPHVGYIKRIDELIAALPASPDSFTLQRRDYDTAYLTYIDVLSKNSSQAQDRVTPQRASTLIEPGLVYPNMVSIPSLKLEVGLDPVTTIEFDFCAQHETGAIPRVRVALKQVEKYLHELNRRSGLPTATLIQTSKPDFREGYSGFRLLCFKEWVAVCQAGLNALAKEDRSSHPYAYAIGSSWLGAGELRPEHAVYKWDDGLRRAHCLLPSQRPQGPLPVDHDSNRPNGFGVRGMHGNVWEIVVTDNEGEYRKCGGAWDSSPDRLGFDVAAPAVESDSLPHGSIGFRVCRTLLPV